jgi:hypothetical protein
MDILYRHAYIFLLRGFRLRNSENGILVYFKDESAFTCLYKYERDFFAPFYIGTT